MTDDDDVGMSAPPAKQSKHDTKPEAPLQPLPIVRLPGPEAYATSKSILTGGRGLQPSDNSAPQGVHLVAFVSYIMAIPVLDRERSSDSGRY